jgi:DNA-binding IclR family transcriptional regulator
LERFGAHEGQVTLPVLAEGAELSKSTLARHLDELESADAVRTTRDGKTRVVHLALSGELRLHRGTGSERG